jgi:hypothetical protein
MSLTLSDSKVMNEDGSSRKKGLYLKSFGKILGDTIILEDYEISLKDWLIATQYILTNADLSEADIRLDFIEWVKTLKHEEGWNSFRDPECKRLAPCQKQSE